MLFKREDEGGAAHSSSNGLPQNGGVGANGFGRRRQVPGAEPVPGAAPGGGVSLAGADEANLSKTALKNKKKREAAKKAKAEQAEGGQGQGDQAQQPREPREPRERRNGNSNGNGGNSNRNSYIRDDREGRDSRSNTLQARRSDHRSRSRHNFDGQQRSKSRNNDRRERTDSNAARSMRDAQGMLSPHSIQTNQPASTDGPLSPSPEEKKRRGLHKKLRAIEDLKMRQASGEKLEDTQIKKIATEAEVRKELEKLGFSA